MTATLSETGALRHVVVKRPDEAFGSADAIAAQWRALGYTGPPDLGAARDEHARLVSLLEAGGATVHALPADDDVGMDSIYVRDTSVVSPDGIILCSMGKEPRRTEPSAQARAFASLGAPRTAIVGKIAAPGRLEGGDLVWLNAAAVAVGSGYRTNDAGIAQLRALLGATIEVIAVPLPHWRGPSDVLHLMSLLSPVDTDLAVVFSPLLPVSFRHRLLDGGITLIEVPDPEYDSMGANVLATAPRRVIMLEGNPRTRAALEAAGAEVQIYEGSEISLKGSGGPTCLTRPLVRAAPPG